MPDTSSTTYFKLFCLTLLGSWAFAGPVRAQCYPGLACPTDPKAEVAPQEQTLALREKGRSYWTHNGSLVYLTADGNKRSFFYEQPRKGLQDNGAEPGSLLFKGSRDGTAYAGTAYVFAKQCGAIPYAVRGSVSHDGRRVTLEGQAPNQINQNCQVTAYRPDTLIFDFSH